MKGATVVVEAKVAKTILAVVLPFGSPARFADSGGAQTRCAQTMRAFSPVSAALLGHITRPGRLLKNSWTLSFDKRVRGYPTFNEMLGIHKTQDGFPINNVGNPWMGR